MASSMKMKQPTVRKRDVNANYDFSIQEEPMTRMGAGSFANLPTEPKYMSFSNKHSYRDGIINSFSQTVYDTSDIHENWSKQMVMLRAPGKAQKISKKVMKNKGVQQSPPKSDKKPLQTPYLQH